MDDASKFMVSGICLLLFAGFLILIMVFARWTADIGEPVSQEIQGLESKDAEIAMDVIVEDSGRVSFYEDTASDDTGVIVLLSVLGVLASLVVSFVWWRAAKNREREKEENTIQILSTPLESLVDQELEQLLYKYSGDT